MIALAFGTRPEFIKLKPLYNELKALKIPVTWFRVDQHSGDDFGMPEMEALSPDIVVNMDDEIPEYGINRINNILMNVLRSPDIIFYQFDDKTSIKLFVVQGDTATAFAVALKCFNLKIPVVHIEAGMRTNAEDPYPEETYRKMITSIADYHFCPSINEVNNVLKTEQTRLAYYVNSGVFTSGNTVIDNIKHLKGSKKEKTVVCTLHRRETKQEFPFLLDCLFQYATNNPDYKFIFVTHPSNLHRVDLFDKQPTNFSVSRPLSHNAFLDILKSSSHVITDSGGISEEANFLDAITIVVRNHTERQDSVDYLIEPLFFGDFIRQPCNSLSSLKKNCNPLAYGNGNAASYIATHINNIYKTKCQNHIQ